MTRPFADYLAESLAHIARDAPRLHARVALAIGRRSLAVMVGDESVGVRAEGERVLVEAPRDRVEVEARTTRRTIVALADGEDELEAAVVGERVFLRGTVDDLEAGFMALAAYLNGAARSPEMGRLMDAFRGEARPEEVGDGG